MFLSEEVPFRGADFETHIALRIHLHLRHNIVKLHILLTNLPAVLNYLNAFS